MADEIAIPSLTPADEAELERMVADWLDGKTHMSTLEVARAAYALGHRTAKRDGLSVAELDAALVEHGAHEIRIATACGHIALSRVDGRWRVGTLERGTGAIDLRLHDLATALLEGFAAIDSQRAGDSGVDLSAAFGEQLLQSKAGR